MKIEDLIELLLSPEAVNLVARADAAMVAALGEEETLCAVIRVMYGEGLPPDLDYAQSCKAAYRAYSVLAELNPDLTQLIASRPAVLRALLVAAEPAREAAAVGYFQELLKLLLSELNADVPGLVAALTAELRHWLPAMALSLSAGQAEAFRHLLECGHASAVPLAAKVFEYLLYVYLNARLAGADEADWPGKYHRLAALVASLAAQGTKLPFKLRYARGLYALGEVRRPDVPGLSEAFYHFRLSLLVYVARTGLSAESEQPLVVARSWRAFRASPRLQFYLLLVAEYFAALVGAGGAARVFSPELLEELLAVAREFPGRDVLHCRLFLALKGLQPAINASGDCAPLLAGFFAAVAPRAPGAAQLAPNGVAAPTLLLLLDGLRGWTETAARLRSEHAPFAREEARPPLSFSEVLSNDSYELGPPAEEAAREEEPDAEGGWLGAEAGLSVSSSNSFEVNLHDEGLAPAI